MNSVLSIVDYTIIAIYALVLVGLGIYLQRKASNSVEDYLIGSRNLPWWMLGFSGMAAFLDVAGTMLIVSFLFMLGPRGLFVELRGGAVLVLIPMMLWTGKWHRRSRCLTGAEWMTFRFGDGFDGRFAQLVKAISGIVLTIGMLGYLIKGIGIFLSTFLPFSPFICALCLVAIAAVYTMLSGFYGVVLTDVFQSVIIIVSVFTVTYLAFSQIESPTEFAETAKIVTGNGEWNEASPSISTSMPEGYKAYESLLFLAVIYTLRNLFFGLGAGDDPKYFAAKSDSECSKLSFMWTSLMAFRWPMMMGFAILGIVLVSQSFEDMNTVNLASQIVKENFETTKEGWHTTISTLANSSTDQFVDAKNQLTELLGTNWREKLSLVGFHGSVDPERVMPAVLMQSIPSGLKGLLLVALIAASMSTFDSEVNKTAGYFARDIYQKYLRPQASTFEIIAWTWIFILFLVVCGFLFAFSLKGINDIWSWIIMGLGGGLMAPLILRMYWWRFNGAGFAVGTICGVVAAIAQRIWLPEIAEYYALLILATVGFTGAIAGSYLAPPTDEKVLEDFYIRTRPFGNWERFSKIIPAELQQAVKIEQRRDLMAIPFALAYQICLFLFPMLFLIGSVWTGLYTLLIALIGLAGLYFIWFRHINEADINSKNILNWRESKNE